MNMLESNPQVIPPAPVFRGNDPPVAEQTEDLEFQGSFVATAVRCGKLGWRLAALDARELVDLAVNFTGPAEQWLGQCRRAGSLQGRVNLGCTRGWLPGSWSWRWATARGNLLWTTAAAGAHRVRPG